MLWESKVDCRNHMVTEAIRRDEVDAVLANLHFCDNNAMTGEDRYYKVKTNLINCTVLCIIYCTVYHFRSLSISEPRNLKKVFCFLEKREVYAAFTIRFLAEG
jgi:hypothetical protein